MIGAGTAKSAHDCSDGGLAVALAECAIIGELGADIDSSLGDRWDVSLFSEGQSRILVTVSPDDLDALRTVCELECVPYVEIGIVGSPELRIGDVVSATVTDLADAYLNGLPGALEAPAHS